MTRQQEQQNQWHKEGRCIACRKKLQGTSKWYCTKHAILHRERQRRRMKSKKRNFGCKTYMNGLHEASMAMMQAHYKMLVEKEKEKIRKAMLKIQQFKNRIS